MSELRSAEYSEDAFASLGLPTDAKETPSSLIKLQEGSPAQFDDLVTEKRQRIGHSLEFAKTFTAS